MRVLRSADYRRMPWKNGGGETIEMVAFPAHASLDAFDWRLSMAHVAQPGPFSPFPGIDRSLSIIAGAGIELTIENETPITLDRTSAPFRFAGERHVFCTLRDGATDDLNVMTRRERARHHVQRHCLARSTELSWQGDVGVVIAIGNTIDVVADGHTTKLGPTDAVQFEPGDVRNFIATPEIPADLFLVEVWMI
ncbi:MAG TPA: HutD family protein [Xanthobacteraceae bacterium]|jgi:hypothetical protein|nr:HutD family protein [Xanthobacteraceae bacterium]